MHTIQRRPPLALQIADVLRREILSGTFAQNEKLVESSLASRFNTSRGPVREALRMLAGEGLVRHEANYGSSVVSFSSKDLKDIMELRIAIEAESVRTLALERDPQRIGVLEHKLKSLMNSAKGRRKSELASRDLDFHRTLTSLAGNELMTDLFEKNAPVVHSLISMDEQFEQFYGSLTRMAEEHEALVEAIRDGDWAAASSRVELHIAKALAALASLRSLRTRES
jgi:DNA-binding GntR family transcriptional regulator